MDRDRRTRLALAAADAQLTDIVSVRQWLTSADYPVYAAVRSEVIKHEPTFMLGVLSGLVWPQLTKPRNQYVYYPGTAEVPESVAPNIRNRSYTIAVEVTIDAEDAAGVLFAHGARFGGHALRRAAVDVSGQPFVDLAAEARMAFMRD